MRKEVNINALRNTSCRQYVRDWDIAQSMQADIPLLVLEDLIETLAATWKLRADLRQQLESACIPDRHTWLD
jgi:hypothetical protein